MLQHSLCHNSKAQRVINLEMAKILKEKRFNDVIFDVVKNYADSV